jgi:hypothetical protein
MDRNGKTFLQISSQCPDVIQSIDGHHPASREARAKARAKAETKKKDKPEIYEGQGADFEVFWARYWRKTAKLTAAESFRKAVISKDRFGLVLTALEIQSTGMLERQPEKRPHASTWLNQRRWEDEPDPQPNGKYFTNEELAAL